MQVGQLLLQAHVPGVGPGDVASAAGAGAGAGEGLLHRVHDLVLRERLGRVTSERESLLAQGLFNYTLLGLGSELHCHRGDGLRYGLQ